MMKAVRRETLLDFFDDIAASPAEFLIHDDGLRTRRFTYASVSALARSFSARLQRAGVSAGDKVIFYSENRPEWLIALWGCLLAGAVAVPIDFRSPLDFLNRVRIKVNAKLILSGDDVPQPAPGPAAVWRMEELAEAAPEAEVRAPCEAGTLAEIIFTSGATAEPKGVLIKHRNVLANIVPVEREVRKYRHWARPFSPIRFLNLLPLSHMFGQAMAAFIPPMLEGTVIFLRGADPREIIRQIRTRRISVVVSVPKILDVLREYLIQLYPDLAAPEPEGTKLHWSARWWRYRKVHRLFGFKFWSFIAGAAPLDPALEAFWTRLGFLVIQGYGLTETAPIVTLNHPFHARHGTVGSPIGGVKVKIAEDGEVLVRGDNVTEGYYEAPEESARAFDDGWFHTGDIGELAPDGSLRILGRKKEMIVTPEGLNVFPEDVEAALKQVPGVIDAAVTGTDRVHAWLILDKGAVLEEVVQAANARLADHQKIREASIWPYAEFPRTEGTGKLKRSEIARGAAPRKTEERFDPSVRLDTLTSLERIELMVALNVDERALETAATVGDLASHAAPAPIEPPFAFPSWNRGFGPRLLRRLALPFFLLPLTRIFAWIHAEGRENLKGLKPPVIFAPNHQTHLDVPVILAALPSAWRYRVAPAMAKEFFDAHFHPERYSWRKRFTNSLNYYLAALCFQAFPIPQREAGTLETLREMGAMAGEGVCVLIFPEGKMTEEGEINPFRPGVGMLAARLKIPVVPVRIEGLLKVLPRGAKMARFGRVRVRFGPPLLLNGTDYAALAARVEEAVRAL
jgi:long-chain acyl-CoA synthetase